MGLMGTHPPSPKRRRSPRFSVHVYRGQTAGSIKMSLGIEVGLSPGDFVLDGNPPPPKKGSEPPIFGPCLLWPNGFVDEDATWYEGVRLTSPRRHCVRWAPSFRSPKRGRSPLTNFWPMSIVAKRLVGSRWHLAWRLAMVQTTLY